ncbi:MAG: GTP-dependent dephospho-CoA kinase family protein [Hadesarchaea archaeon]|nr:GTP-dependent dephospho-CoA kinase family protein [Hadesarchaea archaeon]
MPDDSRHLFKEPFGELFETTREAIDYLNDMEFKQLISVGDFVTAELLRNDVQPDVIIVDYSVERSPASSEIKKIIEDISVSSVRVKNPAGHITEELEEEVKSAVPPLKIIVDGEEDLATIPAVLYTPLNSLVVYGQPGQGMVLVKATEEKKKEFRDLMDVFESE